MIFLCPLTKTMVAGHQVEIDILEMGLGFSLLIKSPVMLIELTVKLTHEMLSTSAGQERLCDVQNRGVFLSCCLYLSFFFNPCFSAISSHITLGSKK